MKASHATVKVLQRAWASLLIVIGIANLAVARKTPVYWAFVGVLLAAAIALYVANVVLLLKLKRSHDGER